MPLRHVRRIHFTRVSKSFTFFQEGCRLKLPKARFHEVRCRANITCGPCLPTGAGPLLVLSSFGEATHPGIETLHQGSNDEATINKERKFAED